MRRLGRDDIDRIAAYAVQECYAPFEETRRLVIEELRKHLRRRLRRVTIYPEAILELQQTLREAYLNVLIEPGVKVGAYAASATTQPSTQMALSSFHLTGSKAGSSSSSGLAQVKAFFNAPHEPNAVTSTVYFVDPPRSFGEALDRGQQLSALMASDLLERAPYIVTEQPRDWWVEVFDAIRGKRGVTNPRSVLVIRFSTRRLCEYRVSLKEVAHAIAHGIIGKKTKNTAALASSFDIRYSPDHLGLMYVYADPNTINDFNFGAKHHEVSQLTSENQHLLIDAFYTSVVIPSLKRIRVRGVKGIHDTYPSRIDLVTCLRRVTRDGDRWIIKLDRHLMRNEGVTLEVLEEMLEHFGLQVLSLEERRIIVDARVVGPGIAYDREEAVNGSEPTSEAASSNVASSTRDARKARSLEGSYYARDRAQLVVNPVTYINQRVFARIEGHEYDHPDVNAASIYKLEVRGSNLSSLFRYPEIDHTRCYSSNSREMSRVLGILATANYLPRQLTEMIEQAGESIEARHTLTSVSFMTATGRITPFTPSGVPAHHVGKITQALHSNATKVLVTAAAAGDTSHPVSAATNRIAGLFRTSSRIRSASGGTREATIKDMIARAKAAARQRLDEMPTTLPPVVETVEVYDPFAQSIEPASFHVAKSQTTAPILGHLPGASQMEAFVASLDYTDYDTPWLVTTLGPRASRLLSETDRAIINELCRLYRVPVTDEKVEAPRAVFDPAINMRLRPRASAA
jgi:hypothetical protein